MKEYAIQNRGLTLIASAKGALLQGIRLTDGRELLWDGKPEIWANRAPVCFPWCGNIKDNWYEQDGVRHEVFTRHGFVRDAEHELVAQSGSEMTFRMDHEGDEVWPWAFTFRTTHKLEGRKAFTVCTAVNRSDKAMPVQFGFHPAFRCPFVEGSDVEEYAVRLETGKVIPMTRDVFDNDSFQVDCGAWARLEHTKSGKYIQVDTAGWFTTLLWSKPGIPGFVCIEPWDGYVSDAHELMERPGASLLAPGESRTWTLHMDFANV